MSNFEKVCQYGDILEVSKLDKKLLSSITSPIKPASVSTPTTDAPAALLDQSIIPLPGDEPEKSKQAILIHTWNSQAEFVLMSDRDIWFTFIDQLRKAHGETEKNEIQETANMVIIAMALGYMKKTPKEDLFADNNKKKMSK